MKKLGVTLSALAALALQASALSFQFQGTFIGTVDTLGGTTHNGLDAIGDTFDGTYSYESATIDGLFSPASGNLMVTINLPDGSTWHETDDSGYNGFPLLSVTGGTVDYLDYFGGPPIIIDLQSAGNGARWDIGTAGDLTKGPISFSDPNTGPTGPTGIPDAGSSAILLGLAYLGLWSLRRYQVAA